MQRPLATNADELDALFGRFVSKYARVGASNIERFAERFCETFGLSEFPRDPRLYLPLFGIRLETDDLPRGVRGVWIRSGGLYRVSHSRYHAGLLGLVLWHELFEILSANPRFPTRLATVTEERLATQFAVHAMMPEQEVRRQAAELRHPQEHDKSGVLSARFGVSMTAMRLRLKELGLQHKARSGPPRYY